MSHFIVRKTQRTDRKIMENIKILGITAITDIAGAGQKCTAVAIEYNVKIDTNKLKTQDFTVTGRTVTNIYANNEAAHSFEKMNDCGCFVILELDSSNELGNTREMVGRGPHGKSVFHKAVVEVVQKNDIFSTLGTVCPGSEQSFISDKTVDSLADRFRECSFDIPGTDKKLNYQLFIPQNYSSTKKYPLVLFIHDAGACADEPIGPLAQGNGAVIWSTKVEQEKHECFIVAPCYPTTCANDDFEVTPEAEYTVELVKEIMNIYPIDPERIYGTGQSMGCMMLCEINIRYPELFAACLLVAGQWNPDTMSVCKNKNFWIIVSQGDAKAFPIMGACVNSMESAGGKVTRGSFSAKATDEELKLIIEKLDSDKNNIHFTWFEENSLIPEGTESHPGLHHVLTWARAYNITALHDWIFRQVL